MQLPLDVEAFVPGSELKEGPQNFENFYHEGDELDLRVIRFDKGRKDIVLSETARVEDREPDEIEEEDTTPREEPTQREEQPSRDRPTPSEDDETTGPTTLGELSGLADLRREMEEEEDASGRAEAAEQAAQDAVEEDADDEADADEASASADADEDAAFDEASGFPDGFPRLSRLENAGVESIAELREIDDLTELDGIGASYAEDIEEGLAEFDEKEAAAS